MRAPWARPADPDLGSRHDADSGDAASEGRTGTVQAQRGTTTAMRYGLWALILLAPVSFVLDRLFPAGPAPRPTSAASSSAAAEATVPAGCAALFVKAYLSAGRDDAAFRRFFPAAAAPTIPSGIRTASGLQPVQARRVDGRTWSVTVAADVAVAVKGSWRHTGTRYFQLPVTGHDTANTAAGPEPCAGLSPLALPAEVAAPAAAPQPDLAYRRAEAVTATPLADTVTAFLAAYLAGAGDVERYTAPGAGIRPVAPAPYTRANVDALRADDAATETKGSATVPADGTRRRLHVTVTAVDRDGVPYPLQYALIAATRGGRWEIAAIEPAPARADATPRPAAPSPTESPRESGGATPSPTRPS